MPVLVILAVLWAVVLVPPLLRSRAHRTASSIVDFNYKLDVLGRTNGNPDPVRTPARASAAGRSAKRRRDVMRTLTLIIAGTLLIATVTAAPAAWAFQGLADVLMAGYLALWAWLRTMQVDRIEKVRYLPEPRATPQPRRRELVLRRSASS